MANLSVQSMSASGLEVSFSNADVAGDSFTNNGTTFLRVVNGDASDITVTVDSPTPCNQGGTHDVAVTVTAGEQRDIGPFPRNRFNDDSGKVNVTYSAVSNITVAAISM